MWNFLSLCGKILESQLVIKCVRFDLKLSMFFSSIWFKTLNVIE